MVRRRGLTIPKYPKGTLSLASRVVQQIVGDGIRHLISVGGLSGHHLGPDQVQGALFHCAFVDREVGLEGSSDYTGSNAPTW